MNLGKKIAIFGGAATAAASTAAHNASAGAHGDILDARIPPIFTEHPFASNPVLTGASVTDRTAQGVADPFIVQDGGVYHMFFEVITGTTEEIGHATSTDGLAWTYDQIVLTEAGEHFAYPFVWKHTDGNWYMIPDMVTKLRIYRATSFPTGWTAVKTVLSESCSDFTPFLYNGTWYAHYKAADGCRLMFTDDPITGTWTLHPQSPLSASGYFRGAGRPIVESDAVYLPIQGYITSYGEYAYWVRLSGLTRATVTATSAHRICERDVIQGAYASRGRHHIDMLGNLAVIDAVNATGTNAWSIAVFIRSNNYRKACSIVVNSGGEQKLANTNTWEVAKAGFTSADKLQDNSYLWNRTDNVFEIPKTGMYRVTACFNEYGATTARACRLRVNDTVSTAVIAQTGVNIPAGGAASHPNSLEISRTYYLTAGMKLQAQLYSNTLSSFLTGKENTYFAIEEI